MERDQEAAAPPLSADEYRLMLENSADVVFKQVGGALRWISPSLTALTGWRPEEVLGTSTIAFWHPDDQPAAGRLREQVHAGSPGRGVFRLRRRDGGYLWVDLSLRPYVSDDGEQGTVGAFHEVGERVAAEQALAASEARYRLLADNATDLLWVLDVETFRYDYVSPSVVRISGYTAEETLSHPVDRRLTPGSWVKAEALVAAAVEGYLAGDTEAVMSAELDLRHKDGHCVPIELTARFLPSDDGRPHKILGVSRDITERKAAEQALRESEARYRAVSETAVDGIVTADADGRIVGWNASAERLFGYSQAEVRGRPLTLALPGSFEGADTAAAGALGARGLHDVMGRVVASDGCRKDGSRFPVELSLSEWQVGGETFVTAIVRDVTDRRRQEEEIRRLNSELERRVQERTLELEASNHELEAFAYSVSHDLRAPLRAIDGFCHILLEDSADSLDEAGRANLGRVRAAAQKMDVLIDALLTLSRLTRIDLDLQEVDLSAMARAALDRLQKQDQERAVTVRVADGCTTVADPALAEIVLANLLSNAWKFTTTCDEPCVEFGETVRDGGPVFFVRDNGVGFDPAYDHKLFEPFQRLHAPGEFPGTGIGLATVRRVVVRLGGRCWAEGAVGEGATFFFTLSQADGAGR